MDHSTYQQINTLPAFGPGTQLMTTEGEVPVEWLATGDRVLTRDHGAQPVLWIGRLRVSADDMRRMAELRPMEIPQGALGEGCPSHATLLGPAHRVLVEGGLVELTTGEPEALAQIDHLADGIYAAPARLSAAHYTIVLLPMHDMVQANGLWAETLHLDLHALGLVAGELPPDLLSNPSLKMGHEISARLCLKRWEVEAMRGASAEAVAEIVSHAA